MYLLESLADSGPTILHILLRRGIAQVTDYLKKKGFTKTEAIFRQETAHLGPDGRPAQRNDDSGPKKYLKGFILLRDWIDNNLDIYKVSRRVCGFLFVCL